ncbi:MAG: cadmium-translocating P-type ATPase [Clostridia bacterium]|nr:cadmium-translocating P-type ATPase [Clostridia bacterium]
MNRTQRKTLWQIGISAILLIAGMVLPLARPLKLAIFISAYLIVGAEIVYEAFRELFTGQAFGENLLMTIATIGAFLIAEYFEAVLVMLLFQIGELFQGMAVGKSRKAISDLMELRPDTANIIQDGQLIQVHPIQVAIGDMILVKPGERVPLDGIVTEGNSYVDTAALTGESVPQQVGPGSTVLSGSVNTSVPLEIQVTKAFSESTATKILNMIEDIGGKKAPAESFITKFSRYYTPIVVICAALLAAIPGLLIPGADAMEWIRRALMFLVVSCPCALVISVPLSYFGGIGCASRNGILIKGSQSIDALSQLTAVAMDKTGTLTKGQLQVTEIQSVQLPEQTLLEYTALAEWYSDHPIAIAIKQAYAKELEHPAHSEEVAGKGMLAVLNGQRIAVGNISLMEQEGAVCETYTGAGSAVYIAIDGVYAGRLIVKDQLRQEAKQATDRLKQLGITDIIMLSGDTQAAVNEVADSLGILAKGELLPGDKVDQVEKLMDQTQGKMAFVGDGINDAPVLTRADVGIAMGTIGKDAAIEAADMVIMGDDLRKLPAAIAISRKVSRIVKQNITVALVIKIGVLILSAIGWSNMILAIFADVGVMVIAILNAMRTLRMKMDI